ncbi:TonB-dependent receptor domain-containing protein [Ectothiorhodospira sp. BSL-9]|uniref:TonB-dependent receptor domain-containing protein n=1 Tax=Ectothiorhodospira sp. BSL-9 TaxID=1442136 RepID=UPI0007B45403|nr:TonB-dependent receptor [Ectothiorhodospira sp. BSL-9]ANB01027.1 TonB-dependent receptor [Ectothiorhodospira sp. BSL-9]
MQTRSFLPAAVLLAIPSLVSAQEQVAQLDPILVTPTRTAQTTDQTLASVTVIDREEIERLQPKEFADLLKGRAGIGLSQNGPFGKNTSLFMRGTESDHTLLLVDGVRLGSATTGQAAWQFLSPSEIERIEIVRGPRTSLYGADAIGGVIQIFTRDGQGPARVRARLGVGSFGSAELGFGVGGSNETTRYDLSAGYFQTDGINVRDDIGNSDRDGYDNFTISGSVIHQLTDDTEVFARLLHSQGETDYDRGSPARDWSEFAQYVSQVGMRSQVNEAWFTQFSVGYSRDDGKNYEDGLFSSRFDTERYQLGWQNDLALGTSLLTLGIDFLQDRVTGTGDFDRSSRDNWGGYIQMQTDLGRHSVSGSLRLDDNEAFDSETTGQIAWGYQFTEEVRSWVSFGTAFKAPTFNELYFPFTVYQGGFSYSGNSELEPEKSETYEVGLRYDAGPRFLSATLFESQIDNLIINTGFDPMRPENVREARIRGLELEGGLRQGGWMASAAYTHLQPEDRDSGTQLQRRSRNTLRLDVDRELSVFTVGGTLLVEGGRYDQQGEQNRVGGYEVLGLRASYAMTEEWTLRAKVDNVFDREYEVVRDYNQPGRAFFVTLNYQQQ